MKLIYTTTGRIYLPDPVAFPLENKTKLVYTPSLHIVYNSPDSLRRRNLRVKPKLSARWQPLASYFSAQFVISCDPRGYCPSILVIYFKTD